MREARALAARGVKELLLISQDTTFYGIDRGERGALARLLRALNAVDGLEWIRLLYLYPTTIDDDDARRDGRVREGLQVHRPAAAARVGRGAEAHERPGTRAATSACSTASATRVPGVTLRTTFIVGFPGETEADFDELSSFVDAVQFDHVGVFTYSHEEGTAAEALADDVPAAVKKQAARPPDAAAEADRAGARSAARIGDTGAAPGRRPVGRARARPARPARRARRPRSTRRST